VRVFVVEGEGGMTAGASHETRNAAWGLGLANLIFLLDWNDFGIDDFAASSVVPGTPATWFGSYGWRVSGTMEGSEWSPVTWAILEAACGENPDRVPSVAWFRTRKGRGYGKYDSKSHGSPHAMNSAPFWELRKAFMAKYGMSYSGVDEPAPADPGALHEQAAENLRRAAGVLADGYLGEVGRTWPVGDGAPVRELYQRADELWDRLLSACRPGAPASDLLAAYEAAGEPLPAMPVAHGLGLGFDPPVVTPQLRATAAKEILEPGMVLAVTGYAWQEGLGAVFSRDAVLITTDGAEVLTSSPSWSRAGVGIG